MDYLALVPAVCPPDEEDRGSKCGYSKWFGHEEAGSPVLFTYVCVIDIENTSVLALNSCQYQQNEFTFTYTALVTLYIIYIVYTL